jgi:ribosomal-protein-alanine N-acetyltransferase
MLPTFETRCLVLRPAVAEDLDALWSLWIDPKVRRFLWDDVVIDREKAREAMQNFGELTSRGLGLWTIARRDSDALIGCAALSPVGAAAQFYPELAGAIEPVIALAPTAWHHGYGYEALNALIRHATLTLQIDRIAAVADAPNTASERLLQRAGFVCCAETDGPRYRLRCYRYERERHLIPDDVAAR